MIKVMIVSFEDDNSKGRKGKSSGDSEILNDKDDNKNYKSDNMVSSTDNDNYKSSNDKNF